VVAVDPGAGTFTARLLVSGPPLGEGSLCKLSGRWMVREGLIATAIALSVG